MYRITTGLKFARAGLFLIFIFHTEIASSKSKQERLHTCPNATVCYMQIPTICNISQLMSLIATLNVFALGFLNHRIFSTRDLTFSSPKMFVSHRRTEGDFKYLPRSKHMCHTMIIPMVFLFGGRVS